MKRIIRLTESDLTRIVKRIIMEEEDPEIDLSKLSFLGKYSKNGSSHKYTRPNGNSVTFKKVPLPSGFEVFMVFPKEIKRAEDVFKYLRQIDNKAKMGQVFPFMPERTVTANIVKDDFREAVRIIDKLY